MAATTTRTSSTSEAAGRPRRSAFRPDIEGLRALAIIPVLVFHAHEFLSPTATGPLGLVSTVLGWIPGGYLGVDVFFVISGFLITGLLVREGETTGPGALRPVLRPPRPAHPARGDRHAAGHARRVVPHPPGGARRHRRGRRAVGGAVQLRRPLRQQRHRLHGRGHRPEPGAALLEPQRRGEVLRRLAGGPPHRDDRRPPRQPPAPASGPLRGAVGAGDPVAAVVASTS